MDASTGARARSTSLPAATALRIAGIAAAYIVVARVGLSLDAVAGFATLVWPASGIALAALILGGYNLWPAIAIGAFTANVLTGAPVPVALGIAAGNTAEAVLGAYLVLRVPGFRLSLERVRDVLAIIVLAAMVSTLVAATIGVTSLAAAGLVTGAGAVDAWRAWWLGDAIGDMLVAPLILVCASWRPFNLIPIRALEATALGAALVVTGSFVFGYAPSLDSVSRAREYMLFPFLIWAAIRFSVRGTVIATAGASMIAIVFSVLGRGPFIQGQLHESLFALQIFVGITAATFLVLGASMSERHRSATEIVAARETAEAANRAKSGFLAVISHELRTPLNAITGYVDLLSLEIDGPLNEKQHAVLARIAQSQRHLLALIEDVLGFAQVEAGRLSYSLQPVVVRDSLESIEPIVGPELARRGLTIRMYECDPALTMRADPHKVRQILLNLVTNSMKFTVSGGVIGISADGQDGRVKIAVSDTGIGIPANHLDHVFEPFYQVDQGGTRRYPGLGLGLSIVRDAVLAMDGDVAIESEPGTGTTVTMFLPRVASEIPVA